MKASLGPYSTLICIWASGVAIRLERRGKEENHGLGRVRLGSREVGFSATV